MPERLAPIALFVFKRADKTLNTLRSLSACPTFQDRHLYIFSDGPRTEADTGAVADVRAVIESFPHPFKVIRKAPENRGLARSIISGVSEICAAHGRVIVIEDDLIVAPTILDYFDEALDAYEGEQRVMQISGFAFGSDRQSDQARFLPLTTSWGWATWERAWKTFDPTARGAEALAKDPKLRARFNLNGLFNFSGMLDRQLRGEVDSWAIRWYLSVFLQDGLVLFPNSSLVQNDGMDRSGTHGFRSALLWRKQADVRNHSKPRLPSTVELKADAVQDIGRFVDPSGLRRLVYFFQELLREVRDFRQRQS